MTGSDEAPVTPNQYSVALAAARQRPGFVDLICTNFHQCGLRYDPERIREIAHRYLSSHPVYDPDPLGAPDLRRAICGFYGAAGIRANPEQVVITASASESYSHMFTSIVTRGGQVLLPRPGYPLFEEIAERSGVECRYYDQHADRGWAIDPDEIEQIVEPETAAIVVISPNNPTGHIATDDEFIAIGAICRRHDLLLIHDEVFSEYRFDPVHLGRLPRPANLCQEVDVVTLNGASKLLVCPDLKVSWMMASGPHAPDLVERLSIANDLFLSASPLNQHLVARMLEDGMGETGRIVTEVGRRRARLIDQLEQCAGLHLHPPQGGIHAVIRVAGAVIGRGLDDESISVGLLEQCGVAAHPGYLYGINDETALIVSYLARPAVIQAGAERLCSFVR